MKKIRILFATLLALAFTSCTGVYKCNTYRGTDQKEKYKAMAKAHKKLSKSVYTPGKYY